MVSLLRHIWHRWTTGTYHSKHYTGRFQDSVEHQVSKGQAGKAQSRQTQKVWDSHGNKQRQWPLTDKNGSECGPMYPHGSNWIKVKVKEMMFPQMSWDSWKYRDRSLPAAHFTSYMTMTLYSACKILNLSHIQSPHENMFHKSFIPAQQYIATNSEL